MSGSITLEGSAELQRALAAASAEIQSAVGDAVQATAVELRADVVRRIQRGPASGITYVKYNPSRTHIASAPGEAPATDTGRLANSITFDRVGALSATVGSELAYAAALEFGTSRIDPRPAWVPAVEQMRPRFMARLERAIGGVIT